MTTPALTTLRRYAYLVFGVACTHLVFGAIVRISGSGMGCGPHWPDCEGYLFPPLSRPDLIIEVMHRYLASILLLSLIGLVIAALRRRAEPGVGGPGGVLRMASTALGLGFSAAVLGAVTVKFMNSAPATVAHWTVAMSLVAAVTATVIRAGGLGGARARGGAASDRTRRATRAGAGIALLTVVMGGLTAKIAGGSVACLAFPLCGANPAVARAAVHVQSTHRILAVLLIVHLFFVLRGVTRRGEAAIIRRAAAIAFGLGLLQLVVAGAMIGLRLPPVLRSLHEATGVSIWIATFALALLARLARGEMGESPAPAAEPVPDRPLPLGTAPVLSTSGAAPRAVVDRGVVAGAAVVSSAMRDVAATANSRAAGEPIDLPAALERATAIACQAALAFALLASARGAPPEAQHTPEPPIARNDSVAHDIILSGSASAADEGAVPDVDLVDDRYDRYHLRDLADADDGMAADPADDAVLSLDEEFSRLALAQDDARDDGMAAGVPLLAASSADDADDAGGVAVIARPASPATLQSLCAVRRPAMSHSIAVIAARGADL